MLYGQLDAPRTHFEPNQKPKAYEANNVKKRQAIPAPAPREV